MGSTDNAQGFDTTGEISQIGPPVSEGVETFWSADNAYNKDSVSEISENGPHVILYEDKDVDTLSLANEIWCYEESTKAVIGYLSTLPVEINICT